MVSAVARCLRCHAGNEWIEGKVKDEPKKKTAEILEAADALAEAVVHRPAGSQLLAAALKRYVEVRGLSEEES